MPTGLLAVLLCLTLTGVVLRSRRQHLCDTTLVAPYRWSYFSIILIGLAEVVVYALAFDRATNTAVRYLAATSTCCPLVAILGAKRPQNKGWQFIVVSLWIVLVLPVAETLILWSGGELDIGPARQWLILILLLIGLGNYLPTRFGIAAMLVAVGQASLLSAHLPFSLPVWMGDPAVGVGCLAAAAVWAWRSPGHVQQGWDRVWYDFRDAFGSVWGLRVIERLNATARLRDWNLQLGWFGFVEPAESPADPGQPDELERSMRMLLRRFVSQAWIDDRLARADVATNEPNPNP